MPRVPIDISDMQRLQRIQDKVHRAKHALEMNVSATQALSSDLRERCRNSAGDHTQCESIELMQLVLYMNDFRLEERRLKTLVARAISVSSLVGSA